MLKIIISLVGVSCLIFFELFRGSLFWGDLPYFFPEEINQFLHVPLTWMSQGSNFGAPNLVIWLSPAMVLWKFLGPGFVFVLPAILLSIVGSVLFTKYLKYSNTVQLLVAAIYTFNTYFLLLIDGGQMGVALSYGFFPLTLFFIQRFLDKFSFRNFYLSVLIFFFQCLADPRIALISVVAIFVWNLNNLKKLFRLLPLGVLSVLLNLFWILPFISIPGGLAGLDKIDISIVKAVHSLTLFSPHWPDNLFGSISNPPFYFYGITFMILAGLLFAVKNKSFTLIAGYFIFLILSIFPLGTIFRDSTKFFIPLILFSGILIGTVADKIRKKWATASILLYFLLLVYPSYTGGMNFMLSKRDHSGDFVKIYNNLVSQNSFFRTAWFSERHPLSFEREANPGVDAKELVKFPVFSYLNVGENPLNFLNDPDWIKSFKVLGIKYLIFSGNPRELSKDDEEQRVWDASLKVLDNNPGVTRVDWGTSVPIYEVPNSYPHLFTFSKAVGVVGGRLPADIPSFYFEDGIVDPNIFEDIDPKALTLFLGDRGKLDLAMSFLQEYFKFPEEASSSQWAAYSQSEYLKYKYQLLIRGVDFVDLDYDGGIGFSTVNGEEISFRFNIPDEGEFVILVRRMIPGDGERQLEWEKVEEKKIGQGEFEYTITNKSEITVLNAVAIVPKARFSAAEKMAESYIGKFKLTTESELEELTDYKTIDSKVTPPLKLSFSVEPEQGWLVFTDNFHPMWRISENGKFGHPIAMHSMVNSYYVYNVNSNQKVLEFTGQKYFTYGLWISATALFALTFAIFLYEKSNRKNP